MDIATITDIIVVALLIISAAIAFFRGLIKEVLTILGIVGGVAMAFFFGDNVVPLMEGWLGIVEGEDPQSLFDIIPYDILAKILAYGSVLISFSIVLSIISHFLSHTASSAGLGSIDRTLGLIFGILRGVLLIGVLYLPIYLIASDEKRKDFFEGSHMVFYLEATSGWLSQFLSQDESDTEATSGARQFLENMDVLKSDEQDPPSDEIKNHYDLDETEDGYDKKDRKGLNQLIGEQINNKQPNSDTGSYNQ